MSEESTNAETSTKSQILGLLVIVLTNVVSVSIGYYLHGEAPDPIDVTCEIAAEVAASAECQPEEAEEAEEAVPPVEVQPEDEAAIEAEEEAAENQPPATE